MDKEYPAEAWRRLGKVLEARRGELGYGFRRRGEFLADRGGPPPSVKMLARLERGERTSYPASTVTLLESLYGYASGSFEKVLAGGEPAPGTPAPAPRPAQPAVPAASEAEEVLARLLAGHSGDEVIQAIGAQPHKPAYVLVGEVLRRLEREGDPAPAREVYAELVRRHSGDEVLRAISRQRPKKASLLVEEMLDWRSTQEPAPAPPRARNGTAG